MATRDDILNKLAEGILALDSDPNYAEMKIGKVYRNWPQIFELNDEDFPAIIIDDNGNVPGPEYDGLVRFNTNVNISAVVRGDDREDLVRKIELMSEALTKYLYSKPVIHANCLDMKVVEREDLGIYSRSSQNFAEIMLAVRILWYDRTVTASSSTGTYEVWNQDAQPWIETARDKLYTRITDLKTTITNGTDYWPRFDYTHERHVIPDLKLNAVSIGALAVDGEEFGGSSSGVSQTYLIGFTVRIHVAYADDSFDDENLSRLVNSVYNKLRARKDLTGGYWIKEISDVDLTAEFDQSESRGAEFAVIIETHVTHSQE